MAGGGRAATPEIPPERIQNFPICSRDRWLTAQQTRLWTVGRTTRITNAIGAE